MTVEHAIPFHVRCDQFAPIVYERSDGLIQLMEPIEPPPFIAAPDCLLIEPALAAFLQDLGIDGVTFSPAVLFDPISREEVHSHVRVRIGRYFTAADYKELELDGLRMMTLGDEYCFVSPALKALLEAAPFPYLIFSPGLQDFAG